MANITSMHDLTSHANYIPELWPGMVVEFRDKNLVMANIVDRRDIDAAQYGDTLHYPITTAGTAVVYAAGKRLLDNLQVDTDDEVTLTIDQFRFHPFMIPWNVKDQVKYDTMAISMRQAGEAIARDIDTAVHTEAVASLTDNTQTGLSIDTIVASYVALNAADVPTADRAWIFHPRAYGDLLTLEGNYFVSYDFRQGRPLENGLIGSILGSSVFQSTNVTSVTAGEPAVTTYSNLYLHRDAIALAVQHAPEVESAYDMDAQGILGNVRSGYGIATLRADHGLVIETT